MTISPAVAHEKQIDSLQSVPWLQRYSTSRDDLIRDFYEPALDRAVSYDRAVGYFRSSFYSLTGSATARFSLRGGRIRLVCSPELTQGDVLAIQQGLEVKKAVDVAARRELDRILRQPLARPTVELLATLVAAGTLDIKFVIWTDAIGIFHDKVGVFRDHRDNALSFSGSINESWHGWHPRGNHESFEVFTSWSAEGPRVTDHCAYFETLWSGDERGLDVYDPPDAFAKELLSFAGTDPRESLLVLANDSRGARRLFPFQSSALQDWESKGRRGVLRHATGSGKTVTALHAVRKWLQGGRPALVLVPSEILLKQWRTESERELADIAPSILLVGGGHDEWKKNGLAQLHTAVDGGPRLTIATIQTASTRPFLESLHGGDHLLVVADEVHRVGSSTYKRVMTLDAGARLGLSATPERFGDIEGTSAIREYFGSDLAPLFGLREAIAAGRLCPYEYFVHTVELSEDEQHEWLDFSSRIGPLAGQPDDNRARDRLKHLLIQRARVAKNATAKAPLAAEIVSSRWREEQHWLIYCESQAQLNEVRQRLKRGGVESLGYHSAMGGDPDATLERFRQYGGVLVAIRCLDEGVDIPEISHAVILASSRNPREFVQRRGRLLRTREGKSRAYIHDVLVIPPLSDSGGFDSLVEGEIGRAITFARDALNRGAAAYLEGFCVERGIDWEKLAAAGIEEGESDEGDGL